MSERIMYARRNDGGVSVNESALCEVCLTDPNALAYSFGWWEQADDVSDLSASEFYPIDNPDGRCCGCGYGAECDE